MKHNPTVTANAVAVTTVIVYVVCRFLVALFPELFLNIARSWFHGIDIGKIASFDLSTSSFILGLVSSSLTAWLVGYLFAKLYNYFLKS
ncbi:MAG: DUF5676 family membrane protein [Patescibacteria group bacterium]